MKSVCKIPTDTYESVLETMLNLVNATLTGDDVLESVYYEQLRGFCELQTEAGRGSGFMWEALADVTVDPAERRAYYERALSLARLNAEPVDTILVELGTSSSTHASGPERSCFRYDQCATLLRYAVCQISPC